MATLGAVTVELSASSAAFLREISKAESSLTRFNNTAAAQNAALAKSFNTATAATNALRSAVVGLAAGLGIERMVSFTAAAFRSAGDLGEMAQAAGVTTKQLQVLQFAATQAGLSSDNIGKSLAQLGRRLAEASLAWIIHEGQRAPVYRRARRWRLGRDRRGWLGLRGTGLVGARCPVAQGGSVVARATRRTQLVWWG
jgi:hypothetical protein